MDTNALNLLLNDLAAFIPVKDVQYVTDAVTFAAFLTAVVKPPASGWAAKVWTALNWVALNVKFAKNAPAAPAAPATPTT